MREILFRGKCNEIGKKCGQLIEGFYAKDDGKPLIAINKDNGLNGYFVDPSTVGQYTGLTDNYGKKIFEGDIIKITAIICESEYIKTIIFKNGLFGVEHSNTVVPLRAWDNSQLKILGNIYDNPELLEANDGLHH